MRRAQAAAKPVPPVVSAVASEAPEPAAALVQALAVVVLAVEVMAAQLSRACCWLARRTRCQSPSGFAERLRLRKRSPRQCSLKVLMKPPVLQTWTARALPASRPRAQQKDRCPASRPKHQWQVELQYATAPLAAA